MANGGRSREADAPGPGLRQRGDRGGEPDLPELVCLQFGELLPAELRLLRRQRRRARFSVAGGVIEAHGGHPLERLTGALSLKVLKR
jgi:hypothetical protein